MVDCRLEPPLPFAPPGEVLLFGAFDAVVLSGLPDSIDVPVPDSGVGAELSVDGLVDAASVDGPSVDGVSEGRASGAGLG